MARGHHIPSLWVCTRRGPRGSGSLLNRLEGWLLHALAVGTLLTTSLPTQPPVAHSAGLLGPGIQVPTPSSGPQGLYKAGRTVTLVVSRKVEYQLGCIPGAAP